MKILLIASEAVPYAKTGGLADVAGILPKFLNGLGHDVRVVMPMYPNIDWKGEPPMPLPGALGVPMGIIGELWGEVFEARLPNSEVPIYFLKFDQYFSRGHLYNEQSGDGYLDNDNRFLFLSRGALQLAKKIGFQPDVVHANDWHTAAAPVYLNTVYRNDPFFARTKSLLTIHNMEYQGRYYSGLMDVLGIGWEHFNYLELEWNNMVNLLKGGIYHATRFNAVSPGYAAEIATPEFGHGLDGAVRDRRWALRGILNGIDYSEWDPSSDSHLPATYEVDDLGGKRHCKRALQEEMHLNERDDVPLFGIIARLVDQKGIRQLADALHRLMQWDIQIALLGSGEPWAHDFFSRATEWYPGKCGCYIGYHNGLAHRIEAGSDFYLMPSVFEPCGLNQLYSLRYGSLPVVHAVGGLRDTVQNLDTHTGEGTGFAYTDYTTDAFINTVGWATYTWYEDQPTYRAMQRRAMSQRFSWENAAREYADLYEEIVRG